MPSCTSGGTLGRDPQSRHSAEPGALPLVLRRGEGLPARIVGDRRAAHLLHLRRPAADQRLDAAAAAYLSAAQRIVAGVIVLGLALPEIAAAGRPRPAPPHPSSGVPAGSTDGAGACAALGRRTTLASAIRGTPGQSRYPASAFSAARAQRQGGGGRHGQHHRHGPRHRHGT